MYLHVDFLFFSLIIDPPFRRGLSLYLPPNSDLYQTLSIALDCILGLIFTEDILAPRLCFLDIMSDALCGPSNALQNFQKHASIDRTLQQDRLVSRQSHSQVSSKSHSTSVWIASSTILRAGLRRRAFGHKTPTKVPWIPSSLRSNPVYREHHSPIYNIRATSLRPISRYTIK